MSVEFEFKSIVIQEQDIQEIYPFLLPAIKSYIPTQKLPKRKRRRKKKTASYFLDEIIDSIEVK